jgi:hypothetical protein
MHDPTAHDFGAARDSVGLSDSISSWRDCAIILATVEPTSFYKGPPSDDACPKAFCATDDYANDAGEASVVSPTLSGEEIAMRLKLRNATGLNFYRGSFVAKPVRIRSHGAFNVVSQGFVVRRQVHFDVATWRPQNDDSYVGLGGAHYHYAFLSFDFSRLEGLHLECTTSLST